MREKIRRFDFSCLNCKSVGTIAAAFCIGSVLGLFLPTTLVAIIEALLLVSFVYLVFNF